MAGGKSRKHVIAAEIGADTTRLDRDLKRAVRITRKRSSEMQRQLSGGAAPGTATKAEKAAKRAGGGAAPGGRAMGALGGSLRGMAAFGGVYGIQAQLKGMKVYEASLVDIAVRGKMSTAQMDKLRSSIMDVSNTTGQSKEAIADYVKTIIDQTGNTDLAVKSMGDLARVAYATNADMSRLAGTVKDLREKLDIGAEDQALAFGILASQADKGAVALDQMDSVLPEVLSKAMLFGHKGVNALRDYGAALQFARRGTSSVAEASTSMQRAMDAFATKRGNIEKTLGIKLQDEAGNWKDLGTMLRLVTGRLAEVQAKGEKLGEGKNKKDVEQWIVSTFGIRGMRAILPMLAQAKVGFGSEVGGLGSWEAIQGAGDKGTIAERAKRKEELEGPMRAWDLAVNKFKNTLHTTMLPALQKLGEAMPTIAKGLTFLIDNFKILAGIWASAKVMGFLRSWQGVGGGGGGGGGGFGFGGGGSDSKGPARNRRLRTQAGLLPLAAMMLDKMPKGDEAEIERTLKGFSIADILPDVSRMKGQIGEGTVKALSGSDGDFDLGMFMQLSPEDQARALGNVSEGISSGKSRAASAVGALPSSMQSPDVVAAMEQKLVPGLDKLTAAMLQMQTVMSAQAMERTVQRIMLEAVNASRAGAK